MTNPGGDTLPKGDIVVDENFFVSTVNEVALLGIPEVCPNVIRYIASLYVYDLFHDGVIRSVSSTTVLITGLRKVDEIADGESQAQSCV